MKKLFLLGIIAVLFLTGCTYNINGFETFDESLRFGSYDEFKDVTKSLDNDYFAVERIENFDTDDVDSLSIDLVFEDVNIYREKRDDIEIRYYGIFSDKTSDDKPDYVIEEKGDALFKVKWHNIVGANKVKTDIYLPDSYELPIDIDVVSADIRADELENEKVDIHTVSGDLRLDDIITERLTISTVSGDIRIEKLETETFDVNTTSGDIRVEASDLVESDINTVSGDIRVNIDEHKGDIEIDSTSGDIRFNIRKTNTDLDIDTLSGSIRVDAKSNDVTKDDDRNFEAKLGNGDHKFKINTVSGDITID